MQSAFDSFKTAFHCTYQDNHYIQYTNCFFYCQEIIMGFEIVLKENEAHLEFTGFIERKERRKCNDSEQLSETRSAPAVVRNGFLCKSYATITSR